MKLVLEELWRELPQGWVMIRRTPNTLPKDGFIEMHFTGDVDLIAENAKLKRVLQKVWDMGYDDDPDVWGEVMNLLTEQEQE